MTWSVTVERRDVADSDTYQGDGESSFRFVVEDDWTQILRDKGGQTELVAAYGPATVAAIRRREHEPGSPPEEKSPPTMDLKGWGIAGD